MIENLDSAQWVPSIISAFSAAGGGAVTWLLVKRFIKEFDEFRKNVKDDLLKLRSDMREETKAVRHHAEKLAEEVSALNEKLVEFKLHTDVALTKTQGMVERLEIALGDVKERIETRKNNKRELARY